MEKHPCQLLREKLNTCIDLDKKVMKCDLLCIHNDDLADCKLFLKAMRHFLEKKDKDN